MNKMFKYVAGAVGLFMAVPAAQAGNEDRAGSAGATELLINPWARSSALANSNVSGVKGIEGMFLNVAGLAHGKGTELMFSNSRWLGGSGININSFALGQKIGEKSVLGVSFVNLNFGEIPITTVELPEGGIGMFNPRYMNLGLSYAREFSNSIYGGVTVKVINENINNMGASGVALDAGIQYVTGERDQIKFGIALRNVGPPMIMKGDGLSFSVTNPIYGSVFNVSQKTAKYELPSLLTIGFSYDFLFEEKHFLTASGAYISNSFTRDQYAAGLDYTWKASKKMNFQARAGFLYEKGLFNAAERATAFTGPSFGGSLEFPLNEKGSVMSFDYSYRTTNPFGGVHTWGIRLFI